MSTAQELRLDRLLKEREIIHEKIRDIKESMTSSKGSVIEEPLKTARARLKSLSNNIENLRYQIRKKSVII